MKYFIDTYSRLGITFDHYLGESFYSKMLPDVEKKLRDANLLLESKGAFGVDLGETLGFARVTTPDGRSLYLTRDLAAAEYRHQEFGFDKCIYVVGTPQTLHFQQLFEILNRLKSPCAHKLEFVGFGHVLGVKTRGGGEFFELNDLLDEAADKALVAYTELVEKRPSSIDEKYVSEQVGRSALIVSALSKGRIKDVHFDWKQAMQFQGDTGPYLLYSHARLASLVSKAEANGISLKEAFEASNSVEDEHSFELAYKILGFWDALDAVVKHNDPNFLVTYALDFAKTIGSAYNQLRVVGETKEVALSRLAIFEKSRRCLQICIELLGMEAIERM